MTDIETAERETAADGDHRDEPDLADSATAGLIVLGGDQDLVCVGDGCLPAGTSA